ncbi:MAG: cobaltochelatase subunit CobN, partial [Desulfobacteraceae bacterium]|nr:cobaltochelatase subunit CobN [Desulfobacteraceae bacterium]
MAELRALADETGILEQRAGTGMVSNRDDTMARGNEFMPDEDLVSALGHYLEEIKEKMIPHGMHTYGRTRPPEQIRQMAEAVVQWQPDVSIPSVEARLQESPDLEMKNLLKGLAGGYVAPGEGNDPMRNPGALPTGRNLYGFNPARLPSPAAWELGRQAAEKIVADHLADHGKYPEKVAVVLWAVELLRNEGINESTILWLMGIRPRWEASGRVAGLEVVPGRELNRPRIDVLINASGLYRDLFADKLLFLDEAVQLALAQTDIDNLLARNTRRIQQSFMATGMDEARAKMLSRLRIFSEIPGSYGNGISEMTGASGLWESSDEVVDVYENRMGFAFGKDVWGEKAPDLLKKNLADVDVAVHSASSNVYGLMDNDDMFAYLGGLAMAVRHESGKDPDTRITASGRAGQVSVEDMALTLDRELRTRYLNPVWIDGMQQEDYAGARAMNNFVEYFWGWQVTTPDRVSASQWQQIHEVYVADSYGLEMKAFFDRANPWAYQSITARMLEAVRKKYWQADEDIQKQLAAEYVMNVVEKG